MFKISDFLVDIGFLVQQFCFLGLIFFRRYALASLNEYLHLVFCHRMHREGNACYITIDHLLHDQSNRDGLILHILL
ncbi:hypothetical protein A2947_00180 [Candidatus Peribacteria bacterium RIFCSPLOWO2_01_FULL_54_110]|nr:MAG: hypothetical protein A3D12_03240 [Candidatus Peribacteria bacterium RIFCSPHIGHO2_02_FULL_55_24]OGJ67226.1 MAG: hypothetical protein A2947_00180 [Candidatus Peribacteria bacterium RIFCSPLOWO2_01_FULL_54_110]